jgi:hypothetical protein
MGREQARKGSAGEDKWRLVDSGGGSWYEARKGGEKETRQDAAEKQAIAAIARGGKGKRLKGKGESRSRLGLGRLERSRRACSHSPVSLYSTLGLLYLLYLFVVSFPV